MPDFPKEIDSHENPHHIAALALLALFAGVLFLNGCNTRRGAGKDIEHAGDKIRTNRRRHHAIRFPAHAEA